jgi:dihydroxyacetone kinase-like protein
MSTIGGAAGPLYGSLFRAMAGPLDGQADVEPAAFAEALAAGVAQVQKLGKAEPEDKTMIDALLPAQRALAEAVDGGSGLADALAAAARAAAAGAESTVPLVARKGRASYLGERSAGHRDPGATSSALLLEAAAETLA